MMLLETRLSRISRIYSLFFELQYYLVRDYFYVYCDIEKYAFYWNVSVEIFSVNYSHLNKRGRLFPMA